MSREGGERGEEEGKNAKGKKDGLTCGSSYMLGVRVAQRNPARPSIPTSWHLTRPRSTEAHNNKALGLTQPKILA
jgi:hypothetical protein